MKAVRDLLWTVGVVVILMVGIASLPILLTILAVVAVGLAVAGVIYLIYAGIHDARIAKEEADNLENRRD